VAKIINEDAGFAQKVGVSLKTLQKWDRLGILVARRTVVVFSLGLVHVPVIMQPLTVPLGVSGFFAAGGGVRGSLLQFFDLAVSALIYYPFFKAWERILKSHARRLLCSQRKARCGPRLRPVSTHLISV
jgi:PTS system cellobiose-specific IIC component